MSSKDKQLQEAFEILSRYERTLIEKMAAEIVERREEFDTPFAGGPDQLVDRYYHLLSYLCRLRVGLFSHLPKEKKTQVVPRDDRPLGNDEFRCFQCRSVIASNAESCPKCGWTWG